MGAFVSLLAALKWYQHARAPHPELPRKLLHAGSGFLTLSFPFIFGDLWPVLLLTSGSAVILAGVKVLQPLRRRLGAVVDGVARPTVGEIYFPISVALVFILARGQSKLLFCVPILVLALADATGALIGMWYGHRRFTGGSKSLEGSVAFLVTAFFCLHVPLLLWSVAGRVETLLISLTLALLVMLLEGSAWRGLDNLFIPVGGFILLRMYLPLSSAELLPRFLVVLGLVAVVLLSRRSTTMLDDSLLAGAFLCYVTWAVAGWHWIVPPAIAFAGFALYAPDEPEHGHRFHTIAAMLAIWAPAMAWLAIARVFGRWELLYPFTLAFATHIAIFNVSRSAYRRADTPLWQLGPTALVKSWLAFLVPFVLLEGFTERNVILFAIAAPAVAVGTLLFVTTEPLIRDTPQTLSRWGRQAASAAGGSLVGWGALIALERFS